MQGRGENVLRERTGAIENMTANRFTVNGVTYTAKPFDFDLICDLEDMGIVIEKIQKMPMSLIRGYFALCADTEPKIASSWIQEHLKKGGNLDDISEAMAKEMDESDFFRSLNEGTETETSTNPATEIKKATAKVKTSETSQQ